MEVSWVVGVPPKHPFSMGILPYKSSSDKGVPPRLRKPPGSRAGQVLLWAVQRSWRSSFGKRASLQCASMDCWNGRDGIKMGCTWETYGKSMENMGNLWKIWEIYGKYGKSMENMENLWKIHGKYMGSIWDRGYGGNFQRKIPMGKQNWGWWIPSLMAAASACCRLAMDFTSGAMIFMGLSWDSPMMIHVKSWIIMDIMGYHFTWDHDIWVYMGNIGIFHEIPLFGFRKWESHGRVMINFVQQILASKWFRGVPAKALIGNHQEGLERRVSDILAALVFIESRSLAWKVPPRSWWDSH